MDFYKIDGKIIKSVNKDFSGAAMVKSVKLLASLLGKETVAEWVENIETEDSIKSIGIDYAQGYYYAKPLPPQEMEQYLKQQC